MLPLLVLHLATREAVGGKRQERARAVVAGVIDPGGGSAGVGGAVRQTGVSDPGYNSGRVQAQAQIAIPGITHRAHPAGRARGHEAPQGAGLRHLPVDLQHTHSLEPGIEDIAHHLIEGALVHRGVRLHGA